MLNFYHRFKAIELDSVPDNILDHHFLRQSNKRGEQELTPTLETAAELAVALLIHYSFDLRGYTADEIINYWLNHYPANWVLLAVIESLYQGRYKAISVEQILSIWHRRGQAAYHFNHEFERLVCGDIRQTLTDQTDTTANPSPSVTKEAVCFSNGHDGSAAVTAEEGNGEKMPVQHEQIARSPKGNCASRAPSRASHPPIKQFAPKKTDGSDFYTKLKAIVQQPEDRQQTD